VGRAELIIDSRPDLAAAKQSDDEIRAVAEPDALRGVMARVLGVTQTVVKTWVLYLVGQTGLLMLADDVKNW